MYPLENQAGSDRVQITDFAQTWHNCQNIKFYYSCKNGNFTLIYA